VQTLLDEIGEELQAPRATVNNLPALLHFRQGTYEDVTQRFAWERVPPMRWTTRVVGRRVTCPNCKPPGDKTAPVAISIACVMLLE